MVVSSSSVRVVTRGGAATVPKTRTMVRVVRLAAVRWTRAGRRRRRSTWRWRALTPLWRRTTWEGLKVGFRWKWQSRRHQAGLFGACLFHTSFAMAGTVTVRRRLYPLASLSQIQSTPSAQDGVPHGIEEDLRAYGCKLIHQAGILLNQCVSFCPRPLLIPTL